MTEENEWSLWTKRVQIRRVVDGDTIDCLMDLGHGVLLKGKEGRVRLIDIDTAETYGVKKDSAEYDEGVSHREFVEDWVVRCREAYDAGDWPFIINTYVGDERGKYGRYLAQVVSRATGEVLNDDLKEEFGEAVEP